MTLQPEDLRKIIQQILSEDTSEIGCTECFNVLDQFAEIKLAGNVPGIIMPTVQDHLNHCENCQGTIWDAAGRPEGSSETTRCSNHPLIPP